jgi:outer membrane receptor for ferrienterochelin and colicin
VRANLLHADDELEISELDEETLKRIETGYRSTYIWLTHQMVIGSRLFFDTAVSQSRIDRDRRGLELEEDVRFQIRDLRDLEVLALRQDWNLQASASHFLRWGFGLRSFDTTYDYFGTRTFDNPLAEIRDDEEELTLFRERFEEEHDSLYLSDRARLSDAVTLELGLRYDRHTQTDESHVTPRLNLVWAVGRNGVVRAAWGRFNQSQRPYELQVEDGDTGFFAVERSEHRVLGYERIFERASAARGTALRFELYRREVGNPLPRYENLYEPINEFPEVEPDRVRIAPDRSIAEGLELFLRGRFSQRTGWWLNYAWASTEDEIDGRRQPRQFDQTHALNLNLDHLIGDHWRVNFAWRYHTGWPTTPLSVGRETDDDGETVFVPVLGEPFSDRFPSYHRLDLRASRRWRLRSGGLELHVDIQNVYDQGNVAGFDYEIDAEEGLLTTVREDWAGFLPSMGVTIEF